MLVETITQFLDHVIIRLISQLIKDIFEFSKDYLNILVGPLFQHFLFHHLQFDQLFFALKLNESVRLFSAKLTIALLLSTAGISLQCSHKLPDVFE